MEDRPCEHQIGRLAAGAIYGGSLDGEVVDDGFGHVAGRRIKKFTRPLAQTSFRYIPCPVKVAIPKETAAGERRVALVPDTATKLIAAGLQVSVQAGAGASAYLTDSVYQAAGVTVEADESALMKDAGAVLKVQPPDQSEVRLLPRGSVLVSFLQPATDAGIVHALAAQGVTAFSLELVPRISRAQSMDALSSQASASGYKAVLMAAERFGKFFPMMMTAAGTVAPARVLVMGAGVAGLQAIATARRLGAVVSAYDVRPVVKEEVQSLGATFIQMEIGEHAEAAGGYAKQLSEETHRRELAFIAQQVKDADIVITTAAIPGQRAPVLITADAVRAMKPGAVIVDLAVETGGNCELTEAGREVVRNGVLLLGPLNLPSPLPQHASQMYARNISSFLSQLIKDGALRFDFDDEIVRDTCVTHAGEVRKP